MKRYGIVAEAFDANGRKLNGNTHQIEAECQRDALQIAESRQRSNSATVRVETRVLSVHDIKR